jgi:hypothetical protein
MKEFVTAAKDTLGEVDEESVITFLHDGREVVFYEPGSGQAAIMMTMTRGEVDAEKASTFLSLFFELMDDDTRRYFEDRLMDRRDPFDLDSEGGVFDLWEYLMGEWSARPTKQPSDYQKPRSATGKASTARTSAKARTSSASRSRASSQ